MHRSGTSALAGAVEEQGVDLGPVSRENRFQPKGNRENQRLIRLHDRILERAGGSWSQPPEPGAIRVGRNHRQRLETIFATHEGDVLGFKDPRMLIAWELWRPLAPLRIGTLRNPVAVRESLQSRARIQGSHDEILDDGHCEWLWRAYNERLAALLDEDGGFPVLNFDRPAEFAAGIRPALRALGIDADREQTFVEAEGRADADSGWRDQVGAETAALYDRIDEHARRTAVTTS